MADYDFDRAWADRYIPAAQAAMGCALFKVGNDDDDRRRMTDLVVVTDGKLTIGVRTRRPYYYYEHPRRLEYREQVTIRAERATGAKTELEKILQGWGDLFLYAFARPEPELAFVQWVVLDLKIVRRSRTLLEGQRLIENKDDGTFFKAFTLTTPEVRRWVHSNSGFLPASSLPVVDEKKIYIGHQLSLLEPVPTKTCEGCGLDMPRSRPERLCVTCVSSPLARP